MQVIQSVVFVIGVLFAAMLPVEWIAVGIASVMTIAGTTQTVVAGLLLRRRLGGMDAGPVVRQALWFLGAAVAAGAVGVAVVLALGAFTPDGFGSGDRLGGLVTMAIGGSAMLIVYLGILAVTRNPQLREFAAPLVRRLRRS